MEAKSLNELRVIGQPVMEPWRQLLLDAADYMEKHGWCAGVASDGRVCAVNAIGRAVNGGKIGELGELGLEATDKLSEHIGGRVVVTWSDSSDQATVVSAMRAAALS